MPRPQYAPLHETLHINTGSRVGNDARADHGTRRVTLGTDMILIERVLNGMRMRVQIPAEVYQGVRLLVGGYPESEIYQIEFAHRDPDLSVCLETLKDKREAESRAQLWAHFFARPLLKSTLTPEDWKELFISAPRRRCMTSVAKRRPRLLARRKQGNRENLATIHNDEREIICYE